MTQTEKLPLLAPADAQRPIALRDGRQVPLAQFKGHAAAIMRRLPAGRSMINLCEDRYCFLATYAAALSAGHTVLLPPSRAEQVVREIESANEACYRWDDAAVQAALGTAADVGSLNEQIDADRCVMVGFTSGSTGQPKRYPKTWRSVTASTARNARAIREALGIDDAQSPWLLATVPPQHMYGMEMTILLPLVGAMAVHCGRPLFPADIARALRELPQPRVLVSTPVHLRAIVESEQDFPPTALTISATAPLDQKLAAAVERKLGGRFLELFGSTETCVIASRRTATQRWWQAYEGVELTPGEDGSGDGTRVNAPWFAEPVPLSDTVELHEGGLFSVCGRSGDMVEVAGKRASLADLTRRLLAIEGVQDAVVFQPDQTAVATIRRVAALVVAPGCSAQDIAARLACSVEPAFMPRPLKLVDALPRNELGKLPREELLRVLRG